jgi:hypothetical protein
MAFLVYKRHEHFLILLPLLNRHRLRHGGNVGHCRNEAKAGFGIIRGPFIQ